MARMPTLLRCSRRSSAKSSTVRILPPYDRHQRRLQGLCYGGPEFDAEGGPELHADYQLCNRSRVEVLELKSFLCIEGLISAPNGITPAPEPLKTKTSR